MSSRKNVWRYFRVLLAPLLLWILFVAVLERLLPSWMRGDDSSDEKAVKEWLDEAGPRDNLPTMVHDYVEAVRKWRQQNPNGDLAGDLVLRLHAEKIEEQLKSLGSPPTKMYPGQLILFPMIYRMEVVFDDSRLPPIAWDSDLPRHESQYQQLTHPLADRRTSWCSTSCTSTRNGSASSRTATFASAGSACWRCPAPWWPSSGFS